MDNGDTTAEDTAAITTAAAAGPRKRPPTSQRERRQADGSADVRPAPAVNRRKPAQRPTRVAAAATVAVVERVIDPLMAATTPAPVAPVKRPTPKKVRPPLFEDVPEAPVVYTSAVSDLAESDVIDDVPYVLPTIIHGEPDPEPAEVKVTPDGEGAEDAEVTKPSRPKGTTLPAVLARGREVGHKVLRRLQPAGIPRQHPRVRRVTRVIRHVDTWSVFKVALLFNIFFYCVSLTSAVMLWRVALNTGTIENIERFFESFGWQTFQLKGGEIYHAAWVAGIFIVVGLTGMAVLVATLFNLITDLIGGIRVTVLEEEVVAFDEAAPRWRRISRPSQPFDGESQLD